MEPHGAQYYHDSHLLDALINQSVLMHTLNGKTLMLKLLDFDYYFLLVETPKRKAQFLLNRSKITEIEMLTQQEAEARLNREVAQT